MALALWLHLKIRRFLHFAKKPFAALTGNKLGTEQKSATTRDGAHTTGNFVARLVVAPLNEHMPNVSIAAIDKVNGHYLAD